MTHQTLCRLLQSDRSGCTARSHDQRQTPQMNSVQRYHSESITPTGDAGFHSCIVVGIAQVCRPVLGYIRQHIHFNTLTAHFAVRDQASVVIGICLKNVLFHHVIKSQITPVSYIRLSSGSNGPPFDSA